MMTNTNLETHTICIETLDGHPQGTGFILTPTLAVTCAHVVHACGAGPGDYVRLSFQAGGEPVKAEVLADDWHEEADIAFLRLLSPLPSGVTPAILAMARDSAQIRAFGYPYVGEINGLFGTGELVGTVTETVRPLLQLHSTQITAGFSGGPVWEEATGRVIGMVTSVAVPDDLDRLDDVAFAIPVKTLCDLCPDALELRPAEETPHLSVGALAHQQAEGHHIAQADQGGVAIVGDKNIVYTTQPWRIPLQRPPRVEHFTGRKADLTQLLVSLQPGRVVTLCGPGGIGKTALASEAIWSLAPGDDPPDRFPDGLVFHSFYDDPKASLALKEIAYAYGEEIYPGPARAARRALSGRQALLVLDGAESADDLRAVLAVRGNCGVLVTSQIRQDAVAEWQDVNPLPDLESVQLLQKWSGARIVDEVIAASICDVIGGLPLAVRIAGRYLAMTEENAKDYLTWLKETPLQALNHSQRQRESVPLLLKRSLNQVSRGSQRAVRAIGLMSPIPFEREKVATILKMEEAKTGRFLGELVNYSLLRRIEQSYVVSHTLVHTYARQHLSASIMMKRRYKGLFFSVITSTGDIFYLHSRVVKLKSGGPQRIYYFTRDIKEGALDKLPQTKEVIETRRTKIPALRNARDRKLSQRLIDAINTFLRVLRGNLARIFRMLRHSLTKITLRFTASL